MNAERLLEHYARIAEAPDAIPRLRRFILDLAVRGKIVPQDKGEGPASQLLNLVAAEKARLRLQSEIAPLSSDEIPFDLPRGWSWSRIGEVCSKTGSGSTPRGGKAVYKHTGIPFLRSQNVYDDGLRLEDVAYIDPSTHARMAATAVMPGDLLLNITGGSMGRCCRVPPFFKDGNVSQHVAIIRPALPGMDSFLHRLVLSPYFQAFIFDEQTGAGRGGLPKNKMDRIAVALPPQREQHRIVAKVDELMALCDGLETARAKREATRDRLAAASVARLNAPDPETFRADARFALDNLPALTTRPDQINQLRQTILNLAVRGKLVPQNPDEESAQLPSTQLLSSASGMDAEIFEQSGDSIMLPSGWQIAPLARLSEQIVDCPHTTPKWTATGEICVRTNQLRPRTLDLSQPRYVSPETYLERIGRLEPTADDILYSREGGILGIACRVPTGLRLCLGQRLMLIRAGTKVRATFLEIVLNSPFITEIARTRTTGGAAPRVNMSTVRAYPIPLPPFAEQHRIVAKVDELMALCDRLEASLTAADDTRRRLLEALLHEALAPGRASEAA